MRSSSATSTPTTSSISFRSATTSPTSSSRHAGCGSSRPDGLAGRLDALHAEPGFTAVALDLEPHPATPVEIGDLRLEARRVAHTDNSHAVRLSPPDGPGIVYSGDCGRAGTSPR